MDKLMYKPVPKTPNLNLFSQTRDNNGYNIINQGVDRRIPINLTAVNRISNTESVAKEKFNPDEVG